MPPDGGATCAHRGGAPPDFRPPFAVPGARRRRIALQKWGPGYVLVLPSILLVAVRMFYPTLQTLWFSVSTVKLPTFETTFVGLRNFGHIIGDPATGKLLQRTIWWVAGTVVLRFILGFLAALVFNAKVRGTILMRVLAVLPWTIPSVVAANLWRGILQSDTGILGQTLRAWGLPGAALNWLGNPDTALPAVMVAYSWAGFPFIMLLILAGLQAVPEEQYEAAKVDGANWWQLFRFITVCWADGLYLKAGPEDEKTAVLIIIGVTADGQKELLAMVEGYRESRESWRDVLRDLRRRGLKEVRLFIGDGGLGLWGAVADVYPQTQHQLC